MSCNEETCCEEGTCNEKSKCESTGCEITDEMMCLANQAWADLLKEKMKKLFEEQNGERMDKVAAASVAMCNEYWQHKMGGKMKCHEHKENIKKAFMG